MFLSKKHISRRAMLRAAGVGVALPLLDSMIPAQTRVAAPRTRLACIEMVHGSAGATPEGSGKNYWSPATDGAGFELSYALEPLAPFRDCLTIVSGTDARTAEAHAPTEGGADHFRSSAVYLTAARAKQTAGPGVENGTSIDQIYAQKFRDTAVASLPLSIETFHLSGTCGFDYSCIYSETISWASPTEPVSMIVNPRTVFETLFGASARNILDPLSHDIARLKNDVGAADRARIDRHLDEVRAVERRIQAIEKHNAASVSREYPAAPLGVPDSWEEHVKLMFDLQVLAFATETTRVSAFKLSRDTSNRVFRESGITTPFHDLSHHNEIPTRIEEFARLNRYHVSLVPYFLQKLRDTPDGDGTLLDHSLVLYGSPMGDSNTHNHRRLPLFLAGHANGKLKGNLHRMCPDATPHANVLLTILQKLGVDADRIGDSTGVVDL